MGDQSFLSIYFIDGPPASGKTTLIRNISADITKRRKKDVVVLNEGFMFLNSDHAPNSPEYSCDWVNDRIQAIVQLMEDGKRIVFVDSSPLIASAYHKEIGPVFIGEALARLNAYRVEFWFIDVEWEETWWRIQARLKIVPDQEAAARKGLGETDEEFMMKRYGDVTANKNMYDVVTQRYHLLTLAKSLL